MTHRGQSGGRLWAVNAQVASGSTSAFPLARNDWHVLEGITAAEAAERCYRKLSVLDLRRGVTLKVHTIGRAPSDMFTARYEYPDAAFHLLGRAVLAQTAKGPTSGRVRRSA